MSYITKVYVTASNPFPGQLRPIEGYSVDKQLSDDGIGINTYIAGGTGPSGSVIVSVTGAVVVSGITMSGTTAPEAIPDSLDNILYTRKKQLFDLASASVNYIGYAAMGMAQTSASWMIKRLSFDANGSLESSEWSSATASWSGRASEVYS